MSRKYYLTQLDIEDTLLAKEKKISVTLLVSIAKQKFLLLSDSDDRITLAKRVSKLSFDADDISNLYEAIESDTTRDKTTSAIIKKSITETALREATEKTAAQRSPYDEIITVSSAPNAPVILLDIEYDETDYSKARMLQTTRRKSRVEISVKNGQTLIRHPANADCTRLVEQLVKNLASSTSDAPRLERIDLSHLVTPEKRNDFFFRLLKGTNGLTVEDVTNVKISRGSEESTDEGGSEKNGGKKMEHFIKRVVLEGRSLLSQAEYITLIDKGFHISSMTWKSNDTSSPDGHVVEYEAGFKDPTRCKDFKYTVKALYVRDDSKGLLSEKKVTLLEPDKLKYLSLLEDAAKQSFELTDHV